jgi:hypothetical protein
MWSELLGVTPAAFAINRELPGEFADMSIADIWNIAKGGDSRARTCLKLLMRNKYRK